MRGHRRPLLLLFPALALLGCVSPKQYTPPAKAVLQDPLPGKALVYLLRAPYDGADLELLLNGVRLSLPAYRYTAISLEPGLYTLRTTVKGNQRNPGNAIPDLVVPLASGERLGFFLPAPERRNETEFVPLPGAAFFRQRMEETGAKRTWTPATRDDFNWFIQYTKLYLP